MMGLGTIPQQAMLSTESGPPPVGPAEFVGGKTYTWLNGTQAYDFSGLIGGTDSEPQDGDLFIVIYSGFAAEVFDPTLVNPAGTVAQLYNVWVQLTVDARQRAIWGIYESASASGGSWITNGSDIAQIGTILVFRNVDTVEAGNVASAGNSNRANPPSLAPLTEEALLISIGCGSRLDNTLIDYSDPTDSFTLIKKSFNNAASRGGALLVAAKDDFASGSWDPATFTGGPPNDVNAVWIAATLSLKPTVAEFGTNLSANNMIYHFDAAHGAYSDTSETPAVDGEGIRVWANKGTAEDAQQPTAARRPLFRTGGLAGRPYVQGIRASQLYFEDLLEGDQPAGFISYNPFTIFVVIDAVPNDLGGWVFGSGAGQNSTKANFLLFGSNIPNFSIYKFDSNFPYPNPNGANILAAAKSAFSYERAAFATQASLWTETFTSGGPSFEGTSTMGFMRNNGETTNSLTGHIYEVFYFAGELNPIAINGVVTLLKRKYGL